MGNFYEELIDQTALISTRPTALGKGPLGTYLEYGEYPGVAWHIQLKQDLKLPYEDSVGRGTSEGPRDRLRHVGHNEAQVHQPHRHLQRRANGE